MLRITPVVCQKKAFHAVALLAAFFRGGGADAATGYHARRDLACIWIHGAEMTLGAAHPVPLAASAAYCLGYGLARVKQALL